MRDGQSTQACTVAFHGGQSGQGKSLIARSLAGSLQQLNQNVLLYDLDPQVRQHHALAWSMPAQPTLADIAADLASFDRQTIKGFFPENKEGVTVVGLAADAQQALALSSHLILNALELFQQAYDVVILDGLSGWESLTLELLDRSDQLMMVCSPDLIGLKQASQDSYHYQELKFPVKKINLILNRCDQHGALTSDHLEKALPGHCVIAALPYFPQATETINQHVQVAHQYPHTGFGKSIRALGKHLLSDLQVAKDVATPAPARTLNADNVAIKEQLDLVALKAKIHAEVLDHEALKTLNILNDRSLETRQLLRDKVEAVTTSLMAIEAPELTNRDLREQLVKEIVNEALGLGPIEDLMHDESITEIMVNHCNQIYIEKDGQLQLTKKKFLNNKQLMTVIERIVAPLGRRVDESQPYVDARLLDGSRVNVIIPPLALNGPCLTIRKFSRQRLTMKDLIAFGTLSQPASEFLAACVKLRKNMIIAGGTGSGKTTLLNIISSFIPEHERIVTIEDAAELNLDQVHVIPLEARPANIEGKGAVTIRDLLKNSLRMTPYRIVVGECRGGEALDMLQAMNTGHEGSLTTVHANSPKDTLARLETMVLMSGMELPLAAIRTQIASAIHIIVQQARFSDGSRKITHISEVVTSKEGHVEIKDMFKYKQTGLDNKKRVLGQLSATGYQPSFFKDFAERDISLDQAIFKK